MPKAKTILSAVMLLEIVFFSTAAGAIKKKAGVIRRPEVNQNVPERRLHLPKKQQISKEPGPKSKKLKDIFDILFEFDFFSQYVSKGLPSSNGPVWQPSINIEAYNIGFSAWANFVLNDEPNQGQFNEVDIVPFYNLQIGNFGFIPAVDFMLFMNKDPSSLNYSAHNVIRPQWNMSYRVGYFTFYGDGFYYVYPTNRFGSYHDFGTIFHYTFSKLFELDTSVQIAIGGGRWNAPRIADAGTRVNNFEYVLALTFNITDDLSLIPVMHIVTTIPEALRRNLGEPDFIWGGLKVTYDF